MKFVAVVALANANTPNPQHANRQLARELARELAPELVAEMAPDELQGVCSEYQNSTLSCNTPQQTHELSYETPQQMFGDYAFLLDRVQEEHGWSSEFAKRVIEEYSRFLVILREAPAGMGLPTSEIVDLVWHEHILDTTNYAADCQRMFGYFVHHKRARTEEAVAGLEAKYQQTLRFYGQWFGLSPSGDIWNKHAISTTGDDCPHTGCIYDCTKTAQCSSIYCKIGYFAHHEGDWGCPGCCKPGATITPAPTPAPAPTTTPIPCPKQNFCNGRKWFCNNHRDYPGCPECFECYPDTMNRRLEETEVDEKLEAETPLVVA